MSWTALRTTVRINGEVVSDFATNNMVFGVETYISAMTRYLTLYPGDMIWMGTDGATQNIKVGDVCDVGDKRDWHAEQSNCQRKLTSMNRMNGIFP